MADAAPADPPVPPPASAEDAAAALEAKNRGNAAFKAGDLQTAWKEFSSAITLDPANHVYWSNRSMVSFKGGQYQAALNDGQRCIQLKPDWAKVRGGGGWGSPWCAVPVAGWGRFVPPSS